MAKNFKIKLKNAQTLGLKKLKAQLAGESEKESPKKKKKAEEPEQQAAPKAAEEAAPPPKRRKAKTKSAFAATPETETAAPAKEEPEEKEPAVQEEAEAPAAAHPEPEKETPPPAPPEKVEVPKPRAAPKEPPPPRKVGGVRLGPTGRHIKDILPVKKEKPAQPAPKQEPAGAAGGAPSAKKKKIRDFKDLRPKRGMRPFEAKDRRGGRFGDDERWRKKRGSKQSRAQSEENIVRPSELTIRLPISVKDLAAAMKYKASEVISKLFMHGMVLTLNDLIDDETTVQLIGQELGCEIRIDTSEEERIRITAQTVREEIQATDPESLEMRPPVVAFMGHVDHGKTSLIDKIRESNLTADEAGAITQHIGAFRCETAVGPITILDTPGHEAFSAMRARGAEVTDIVVLVIAGDEGLKEQTKEAIQHAKEANVTIVVAINKCDKDGFNAENVYRELSDNQLLPEAWGGQTITVNTSAITGQGVNELLEMLALQSEVLELRANPKARARGVVLESELHKGLGNVATVLVQNGTLRHGDAIVFDTLWGRVKTMHDEHNKSLQEAGPSAAVEVTGLSGLPTAGEAYIAVANEKEAREIAEARAVGVREKSLRRRRPLESIFQEDIERGAKKILKLILRADVQGSVEALKTSLLKIESDKAEAQVIFTGVGEISESDIQLAAASNAIIVGFHTAVEAHADPLLKELGVKVLLHDVIYHAVDEVRDLMTGLLDKVEQETERGVAEVRATFKASTLGVIAGCMVIEGSVHRNHKARLVRDGEVIWKGGIASIKREKEDVREVKKGFECGILLEGFNQIQEGDRIETYEITYLTQTL